MNQNPSYTDSEEIQTDTRDLVDQFQDMTPAGTVPIKIYARPSGTKGAVPMGDAILLSMFGKKTVNAGASVVYSPAILKPSMSIWYRRGPVVFFGRGGVVDQGKISAVNKGAVGVECSKPAPLFPQNVIPWKIWQTAHQFDRPTRTEFMVSVAGAQSLAVPLLITSEAVDRLRRAYREPVETMERVLRLEVELYPLIRERWERNREKPEGGGGGSPWGEED